jgi:hypothetical protein
MAMLFKDIGKEAKKLLGDVRHTITPLAELVPCSAWAGTPTDHTVLGVVRLR